MPISSSSAPSISVARPALKVPAIHEVFEHHREADSFDFRRSWEGIKRACLSHRRLIAGVCALTFGLTLIYVKVWPPSYIATVTLVGESGQDASRGSFYQTWNVFRNDQLTDEVHMITAGPVLTDTIQRLHLKDADVYHSFFGYAAVLWTDSWIGKTYRKVKETLFPPTPSRYTLTAEQIEFGRTLADLRSGVHFERLMESNLGNLSVLGPTPDVADIANTIVATYFEQRRQRHMQEADDAYRALEQEASKAEKEVTAAEDKMRRYYSSNGLLMSFEKDKIDISQMQAMKGSIEDLQAGIASNAEMLKQLGAELGAETPYVVASRVTGINPLHGSLRSRLADLQISRKQAEIHYRPGSPEVSEIERQIAIVNEQMAKEPAIDLQQNTTVMSSQYEGLRGKAAEIRATLAGQRAAMAAKMASYESYRTMLATLPEKMRAVHDMDREHEAAEKKYGAIQDKMMVAAVSRASAMTDSGSIRVVEAAAPPTEVLAPRTKLLLIVSIAVGLVAGMLLALLIDFLFGRVHRFRPIGLGGLQIYATVQRDHEFVQGAFALKALASGDFRMLR